MTHETLWQSDERQLQLKMGIRAPTDLFQETIQAHNGEVVTLKLIDGLEMRCILVSTGDKVLFCRVPPVENWLVIPLIRIVAIILDNHPT